MLGKNGDYTSELLFRSCMVTLHREREVDGAAEAAESDCYCPLILRLSSSEARVVGVII